MTRKKFTVKRLLYPVAAVVLLLSVFLAQRQSQTVIRLHDDQIELQKLVNAIAEIIISKGYNYKVVFVESTIKEARELIVRGDIDIALEFWKENNLLWYRKATKANLITDMGEMYNGGKQFWLVSKWYANKHGIKTVFDMQHHWQNFRDPDDPSKGLFFNCIYGWTCRDINRVKLQAYGLDKYYNTVSPVSPKSLNSIYAKAQTKKLPVFGYYWQPNSIMAGNNWYILKEPPYSEKIWQQVIKAASAPSGKRLTQACAFNDSGAHKVVYSKLASKAPNVYHMVKKMNIDVAVFNRILLKNEGLQKEKLPPGKLARQFLLNHPEQWKPWIPPDVQQKIQQALRKKNE